jgi:glycine dehydrogenase subunit 1
LEVYLSYVLNTADQQRAMLKEIGVASIGDLFQSIPTALQLNRPLNVPPALTEMELTQHMQELAARNRGALDSVCFQGGGCYDHFIPAVVDAVAGRSEYYTAYTPYQAEASQGSLQAFFEYQTLICQLTGMDVANASLYDGGSAVAEAVFMARAATQRYGRVLIAESVHPEYRQVLATYLANLDAGVQSVPTPEGFLDPDDLKQTIDDQTACVVVQHPNFFGGLEEVEELAQATHAKGALFVVSFDPISLGLLKRPGEYGADIAVAEGQCLGNPMVYGGPFLGILACQERFVRRIPGRLVGQTVDRGGKPCWVLTLQTREQHIRREKATSNICTNQGLMALKAAVYLAALGPQGLKETAELCARKAHYTAEQLARIPGIRLKFPRPFFKEFTLNVGSPASGLLSRVLKLGYHGGLELGRWYPAAAADITVAVTEKRTRAEIDGLVKAYAQAMKG